MNPLPSEMWQAFIVHPLCFVFTSPLTQQKTYFYVHASEKLSFYERVGLALKELAPKINDVHEELIDRDIGKRGPYTGDVDPKWVEPHLVKCLPTRQGNGIVWEGPLTHTSNYWRTRG